MDSSPVGQLAAQTMEKLAAEHDGATIRTVALVVEVDDGTRDTEVIVFSAEDRGWFVLAFLHEALYALEDQMAAIKEDD